MSQDHQNTSRLNFRFHGKGIENSSKIQIFLTIVWMAAEKNPSFIQVIFRTAVRRVPHTSISMHMRFRCSLRMIRAFALMI